MFSGLNKSTNKNMLSRSSHVMTDSTTIMSSLPSRVRIVVGGRSVGPDELAAVARAAPAGVEVVLDVAVLAKVCGGARRGVWRLACAR